MTPVGPAACACLNVVYEPTKHDDATFSERWRCHLCYSEFVRAAAIVPLLEQYHVASGDAARWGAESYNLRVERDALRTKLDAQIILRGEVDTLQEKLDRAVEALELAKARLLDLVEYRDGNYAHEADRQALNHLHSLLTELRVEEK
jgi:hypothetical protein